MSAGAVLFELPSVAYPAETSEFADRDLTPLGDCTPLEQVAGIALDDCGTKSVLELINLLSDQKQG